MYTLTFSHGKLTAARTIAIAGSAWEWDARSQEYYLHLYLKEHPDLNWKNVEVRRAVHNLMRVAREGCGRLPRESYFPFATRDA